MSVERADAIDPLVTAQHGLLTTSQGIKLLGRSRFYRWVREGRLTMVQPSVFRIIGAPETWHQTLHAAQLASDGVVSHRSAAELWGMIPPAGYVDVSVHPTRRPRVQPPAILHRIKDLHANLAVEREGMPITDPVRTVVDLGLVVPRAMVRENLRRGLSIGLFTLPDAVRLREALGRQGRNGTGIIGELLDAEKQLARGDESELEARFRRLVRAHGLARPVLQHEVWSAGRFIARVDAAYPALRLAIEVDGFAWHTSLQAFQHDRTRQNRLVALGWTVLRFTWADIVHDPRGVAETIRAALARLEAA
jgi:very-short-patch-repair endonuclease